MIALLLAIGIIFLIVLVASSVLMGAIYIIVFIVMIVRAIVKASRSHNTPS